MIEMLEFPGLDDFIRAALREDIGSRDITTESCVPPDAFSIGDFHAKEHGIICGLSIASRTFKIIDSRVEMLPGCQDGSYVMRGDIIAAIRGPSRAILTGERVALNILQRLSGIATAAASAVQAVEGTGVRITDTRKTTPGMRMLEKYAVRTGGASNHRFGLFDGVLIKDNHIKAAGSITNAVNAAKKDAPHTLRIEVECETIEMVAEALECNADIVMLDNMTNEEMRRCVEYIGKKAIVEASGNMSGRDIRAVAECGVDYISIGALTHSVHALDISLRLR